MSDYKIGDSVQFRAGRSTTFSPGTVSKAPETTGEGRTRKTWITVKGADGRERRVMPGALRAA